MLEQLLRGMDQLGIEATPLMLERFEVYRAELLRWSERVNLTAITEPAEVEVRHFLDCLTPVPLIHARSSDGASLRLIDVGSGAGFPGLPLKLVLPDAHVTLLEATGKKVAFLAHMADALSLSGVEIIHGRAEDVAHWCGQRERYHFALARAVAPLATLAELCLPFVSVGGAMVALKKADIDEELSRSLNAFSALGGTAPTLSPVELASLPDRRCLACSTKTSPSPSGYPRRAGMPLKRPL